LIIVTFLAKYSQAIGTVVKKDAMKTELRIYVHCDRFYLKNDKCKIVKTVMIKEVHSWQQS